MEKQKFTSHSVSVLNPAPNLADQKLKFFSLKQVKIDLK